MNRIGKYVNGNTIVEIFEDGTKIRYVPDDAPALPDFPESIDMKISNRCFMNCAQCHEQSSATGAFADLDNKLIDSLHPYTELAIGGGDPLLHPQLSKFLIKLRDKKVIANITVHWKSFIEYYDVLNYLKQNNLIYGTGISVNEVIPLEAIDKIASFPDAVIHTIIGVASKEVYKQLADRDLNILLLGYKTFGRGIEYKTNNELDVDINTVWAKNNIENLRRRFKAVSFDNLAIKQVELQKILDPEEFSKIYMGDDGTFTMYIDLVENKFAVSSTSDRQDINSDNIEKLFNQIRKENSQPHSEKLSDIWYKQVKTGNKSIDDVPRLLQPRIKAMLRHRNMTYKEFIKEINKRVNEI